jgi:hypothetical protein
MNIIIKPSSKPDKKYTAIIDKKSIHFGASGMSDYTIHKDDERKQRYLQRHKHDHFNNPLYPSFFSTNLLWNKKTLSESIKDTNKKYNVNIKMR